MRSFFWIFFLAFFACKATQKTKQTTSVDNSSSLSSDDKPKTLEKKIDQELTNFVGLMKEFKAPNTSKLEVGRTALGLTGDDAPSGAQPPSGTLTPEEQKKAMEFIKKDVTDVTQGAHGWTDQNAKELFYSPAFDGLKEEVRASQSGNPLLGSWFDKLPSKFAETKDDTAQTTLFGTCLFIGLAAYNLGFAVFDVKKGNLYNKADKAAPENLKFDRKAFTKIAYARGAIGFGLGFGMLALAYAGHKGLMSQEDFEKSEGSLMILDGTTIAIVGAMGMCEATKKAGIDAPYSPHFSTHKSSIVGTNADGTTLNNAENMEWAIKNHLSKNLAFKVGMVGLIGFGLSYAAFGSYNVATSSPKNSDKNQMPQGALSLASADLGEGEKNYFQQIGIQMDKLFELHDQWIEAGGKPE